MEQALIFESAYTGLRMEQNTIPLQATDTGSTMAFEDLFKSHYKRLHAYACTIVKDEIMAEEMVQQVFYKLWEKRDRIQVQQSVTAYLYRSVYHESINYLRHAKVKSAYQFHAAYHTSHQESTSGRTALRELEQKLDTALKELPQQCRTIFQMSRFEELKYREIADQLGLSVKTVENQMGKALRLLRVKLADFLPAILSLLFINQ